MTFTSTYLRVTEQASDAVSYLIAMTPEQTKLVQASWARIAPSADQVAVLFYDRLFEIAPETEAATPADWFEQGKALMQVLALVVRELPQFDGIAPALEEHRDAWGLFDHDGSAREALLWTLRQGLGDDFTADLEQAWRRVLAALTTILVESRATTKA